MNVHCNSLSEPLSEPLSETQSASQQRWIHCKKLETEIVHLAGHLNAAEYRLIKLLDDFDENKGWHGDGIKSFAHWLNWKIGMGNVIAREKVRVARALRALPQIDAAFSQGEISYSKVRAMTRAATPANESFLLQIAKYGTAQHMELLVQKFRYAKQLQDKAAANDESWRRHRGCFIHHDDLDMVEITLRLPREDGEIVIQAMNRIVDQLREESRSEENVSAETFLEKDPPDTFALRADAFTLMAEQSLSNPIKLSPPIEVLLHINVNPAHLDYQINGGPVCYDEHNHALSPAAARRLACDCSVRSVVEDNDGNVLDIGRKSRVVPSALKKVLRIRDQGCQFPGCCQTKWTDAHHVQHWIDGGKTSLDNLITLYRYHHTQLHKGTYRITSGNNQFHFINADNKVISRSFYPQFELACTTIEEMNNQSGIDITTRTAASKWRGDKLDVHHAVMLLCQKDG